MMQDKPVIVALPLDDDTHAILAAAQELGLRLRRSVVLVHALGRRALESKEGEEDRIAETETLLAAHITQLRDAGLTVSTKVAVRKPAELILETAHRENAELIVVGGGRPSTVRRWLMGSVAEAVVRRASAPAWVVRGKPPVGRTVLCAVGFVPSRELSGSSLDAAGGSPSTISSASKQALFAGIRIARAFNAPVRILTVLPKEATEPESGANVVTASVMDFLGALDLGPLEFEVRVVRGDPAERIVDSAKDAGLVVIGSRGFDPVAPEHLGPITSRTLRYSSCSALMIREVDGDLKRRETAIEKLADDYKTAWMLMNDNREAEALPLLESAAQRAPANARIQEAFAVVLDRVGRKVEARGRREIAAKIRKRIGDD